MIFGVFLCLLVVHSHTSCGSALNFDEECAPGSLNGLHLLPLILSAGLSPQCYAEARNVFNRTYSKANFYIDDTNGSVLDYNKQSVRIKDIKTTRNVLKIFGDMIQFINISFTNIDETKGIEIGGHIITNSTRSLKELHLMDCYGTVLEKFDEPFRNVGIASFGTQKTNKFQFETNAMKLNELFPNVKHLRVKIFDVDELKFVGESFPVLQTFIVELPESRSLASNVVDVFKASPNIDSLTMHRSSLKLLNGASKLLPQLKVLQLIDFWDDSYLGGPIHFKNVYHLDITTIGSDVQVPDKLIFYQLRQLSLSLDIDFTDQWIKLFNNQVSKSVEILDIKSAGFTKQQLLAIAESVPNVKIASIASESKISADTIICFLAMNNQLLSLQVKTALIDVAERKYLYESLRNEWDIKHNYPSINVITFTFSRLANGSASSIQQLGVSTLILAVGSLVYVNYI